MLQPKAIDWLNGYKTKTRIYAVCKRPTSDLGKWSLGKWSLYVLVISDLHIQTENEEMEKIFHANGNEKKAGIPILTSDKVDFKIKTITRDIKDTP